MFRASLARGFNGVFRHKLSAHCDSSGDAENDTDAPNSLIEQVSICGTVFASFMTKL